jgi:hypothetical protein
MDNNLVNNNNSMDHKQPESQSSNKIVLGGCACCKPMDFTSFLNKKRRANLDTFDNDFADNFCQSTGSGQSESKTNIKSWTKHK